LIIPGPFLVCRIVCDTFLDPENYRFFTENIFGKKILVTDRDEWSEE